MRGLLLILPISLLLTSCARFYNDWNTKVNIITDRPAKLLVNKDTVRMVDNEARLKLPRGNDPVSIVTISDSITRSLTLHPKNSVAWWSNILFNYGIGLF